MSLKLVIWHIHKADNLLYDVIVTHHHHHESSLLKHGGYYVMHTFMYARQLMLNHMKNTKTSGRRVTKHLANQF